MKKTHKILQTKSDLNQSTTNMYIQWCLLDIDGLCQINPSGHVKLGNALGLKLYKENNVRNSRIFD